MAKQILSLNFFPLIIKALKNKRKNEVSDKNVIINRAYPSSSLTNSSFSSKSSLNLHSQTVWARDLKFWQHVHLPPWVTCHISRVTCHMSCVTYHLSHITCPLSPVTCHVSYVMCHMLQYFLFFFSYFFGQSGEASRWRVCYQRGLPRLVYFVLCFYFL